MRINQVSKRLLYENVFSFKNDAHTSPGQHPLHLAHFSYINATAYAAVAQSYQFSKATVSPLTAN